MHAADTPGPDHPSTLTTHRNVALWTGHAGDAAEALRLLQELLPDQIRVLGPDHPETLATRNKLAAGSEVPAAVRPPDDTSMAVDPESTEALPY